MKKNNFLYNLLKYDINQSEIVVTFDIDHFKRHF